MIRYNVGDLIECSSGVYVIVETQNESPIPADHKYKVLTQSGEVKQANLFQITHRCI